MSTILGIGTAHKICSLALIRDGSVLRGSDRDMARGHAEHLVPMIADLVDDDRPDGIVVECGPGSFTGIRVGIAAARALAYAWAVPLRGVSSMALLAARASAGAGEDDIACLLDGGRGEVFVQHWRAGVPSDEIVAVATGDVSLAAAAATGTGLPLVALPEAVSSLDTAPPSLSDLPEVAPALLTTDAAPIYVRPPDAKPPAP
ncbi:MAG: tRNA (adenosine(37)-N6)-threonylcarbamoyltransferase complex dimerization subunit type 1 TsaB [Pseudomonadota bacterium]